MEHLGNWSVRISKLTAILHAQRFVCKALKTAACVIATALLISSARSDSKISTIWSANVPPLQSVSLSPKGDRLALLTADRRIAVWNAASGVSMWSQQVKSGSEIKICDGAGIVMLYDLGNPLDRTIRFLNSSDGSNLYSFKANRSIWSTAIAENGRWAAVGDTNNTINIFDLKKIGRRTTISLRGIANGIFLAPDCSYLAAGLWNDSGLDIFNFSGKLLSTRQGLETKRYEPIISSDSQYVLALSYENRQKRNPTLTLYTRNGEALWSHQFGKSASNVKAITAKGAVFTAASYYRQEMRDRTWTLERHLIVLDRRGKERFDIGGLYISFALIILSPDNAGFIAYDGNMKLYRVNNSDSSIQPFDLSAPIRSWSASSDNRKLLIHTIDNRLTLLSIK